MASSGANMSSVPPELPKDAAESIAVGGALLCLLHCLFLPVLLAWLPAIGRAWIPTVDLHLWLVVIVGPMSAWLLLTAVRSHKTVVLAAGFTGLSLLILALMVPVSPSTETLMSVTGSILLAGAHSANWVLRRSHRRNPVMH